MELTCRERRDSAQDGCVVSLGVLFDPTVSRNVCMVHGETKAQPAREIPCLGMPLVLWFLFQNCNLNAADVIPCSEQALDLHGRAGEELL